MSRPKDILENLYIEAGIGQSDIQDESLLKKIELVCRCSTNKAPIRFLMACLLAKIDKPSVDIRKPYTEIGGVDTFSGRAYDESFVQSFVAKNKLPCNPTTAFLTPAFRNIDRTLTTDLVLVGKPKDVYKYTLELLDLVHNGSVLPSDLLKEILRMLGQIKHENETRMQQLLSDLNQSVDILPLSSEQIFTLLSQHLNCKNSSRLPVLMVASAYLAVEDKIGETVIPLQAHNAADKQTGSLGDVEITLTNDEKKVTIYEMKDKKVTKNDIDHAITKLAGLEDRIDNYIFITTEAIDIEVNDYAKSMYDTTGIEFAILDCLGFIRHYLHLFHRHRSKFLNLYQELVLKEPDSSVSQPLKEAFLALRRAAESDRIV